MCTCLSAWVGYFKREYRIEFRCADVQSNAGSCRIDFVISTSGGLVFLEVDENQHQYGYDALVSCDMRRMSHVIETLTVGLGCQASIGFATIRTRGESTVYSNR